MDDIHSPKPERDPKHRSSPLDDVHAAPYEEFAARILADEVFNNEKKDTQLSRILHENNDIEPGSEAAVQAELDRFVTEIETIKKDFGSNPQKNIKVSHDDFEVVFDPEVSEYCIEPGSEGDLIITINNTSGEFKNLLPLYIPASLRIARLSIYNYPLASIPDMVKEYEVSGMDEVDILMPKISKRVYVYNTFASMIPPLPEGLKSLSLYGNPRLTVLPDLPEGLSGLHVANNGSAENPKWYSVDMLPTSLKALTIDSKDPYSRAEKREMNKRGIDVHVV